MFERVPLLFCVLFVCCGSEHYTFVFPWFLQDLDSKVCLNVEFPYYDKSEQVFHDLFSYIGGMVHLTELMIYRNAHACSLTEDLIKNGGPSIFSCKKHENFTDVFKWIEEEVQDYYELLDVLNMAWVDAQKQNDKLKRQTLFEHPLERERTENHK